MSLSEKIFKMEKQTRIGFFGPLVAIACIVVSILLSPGFDWFLNALSDLGHYTRTDLGPYKLIGAIVFNSGLIITGLLMLYYAIWFFRKTSDASTKIGMLPFIISLCFLVSIGIFSEDFGEIHYWVSVGFFLTFPFSMWLVGISWLRFSHLRWFSVLSLIVPFISVIMWVDYLGGTSIWQQAVPEMITALSAILWFWIINLFHHKGNLAAIMQKE